MANARFSRPRGEYLVVMTNLPPTPQSPNGGILQLIWRGIVGVQAAAAVLAVLGGLLVVVTSLRDGGDWSGLAAAIGGFVAVVGAVVLVWSIAMLVASKGSPSAAAILGGLEGVGVLLLAARDLSQGTNSDTVSSWVVAALAAAWLGLCATYRSWPIDKS